MDNFTKSWLGTSAFIAERDRTARVQTARLTRAGETPEPWMLEKADAILSTAAMVEHDSEAIRDLREARSRWPDPA